MHGWNKLFCILIGIFFLLIICWYLWYLGDLYIESNCKDVMESQVYSAAQLLKSSADLKALAQITFFPDQSGSLFVMDLEGNVHVWDHQVGKKHYTQVPFEEPFDQLKQKALEGGGYISFSCQGNQKIDFVIPVTNTKFFIGSGMMIDQNSQNQRKKWKMPQKLFCKKPNIYKTLK